MQPTEEQQAIIDLAVSTKVNILINATPGSGKTTECEMIIKALPGIPILYLVFNKRNAEEATKRLPSNAVVKTLNSVGHSAWAQASGRRLIVESKKTFNLLKEVLDDNPREGRAARGAFADIMRAVSTAKLQGYIPHGKFPQAKRLIEKDEFYENLEEEVPIWAVEEVLHRSIQAAYAGQIDFDDQIYMSALFGGTFPRFPLVMVDEAQDLSAINHEMLSRLVTQRIIAVGDPFQSIYAFRGADTASMRRLEQKYNMTSMSLSTSFRCPIEVVLNARRRAPHMQWAPWAQEGSVNLKEEWKASEIPDGSAIICRFNAPLFKCALTLLKYGRGVKLVGTDLGPGLVRALRKLGPENMEQEDVLREIDKWQTANMVKLRKKASIADKADCLRVFASFGPTLGGAIAYAEHLFAAQGPVQLLSGHKAKGLEWDVVYHLNSGLIPSKWSETVDDKEQEENIRYVIETRSKRDLHFVTLEGLRP